MAQPILGIRLKPNAGPAFTDQVFRSLAVLTDKINLYNYDTVMQCLREKGFRNEIAKDFPYSACYTFDLNYRNPRSEYYVPTVQTFLKILHSREYSSVKAILKDYAAALAQDMNDRYWWQDTQTMCWLQNMCGRMRSASSCVS